MKDWIKQRLKAVMDHVVGGLALIGVIAAIAAIATLGGRSIAVEGWEVIVLVALLIGLIGGEVLLFRRAGAAVGVEEPRGPHAALLERLHALEADLEEGPGYVGWPVGHVYNDIFSQARSALPTVNFEHIEWAEDSGTGYVTMDRPSLRALVRQLRTIIEGAS